MKHAQVIWDYLAPDWEVHKADFMLVLGSSDLDVAKFAGDFWFEGLTEYAVISGGYGKVTKDLWHKTEAAKFSEVLLEKGVPKDKMYLEENASNTGENISKSRELIKTLGKPCLSGVLVTKPYMKRRAYNTAKKQWHHVDWYVAAESVSFKDYVYRQDDPEKFLNIMVGDLQRIKIYGDKGFQIQDDIPDGVWKSYEVMAELNYDKYLLNT